MVPMAALRSAVESLGYTDVSTYIQSGNVVFTAAASTASGRIENAIEGAITRAFGLTVSVVVRTAPQLARAVEANPFAAQDLTKVHLGSMASRPPSAAVAQLDLLRFAPETAQLHDRDVYFHLPNGTGRSKLPSYVERHLATPVTIRNWNTVTKLVELTAAPPR